MSADVTISTTAAARAAGGAIATLFICALATVIGYAGAVRAQAAGEWHGPEHIYRSACVYCHETGVAPVLKGRQLDLAYIGERVRKGFGPMPAFKPSEIGVADLQALAAWLHASAPAPADGN